MTQEWVCAGCEMLNRLDAATCFHCAAPRRVREPLIAGDALAMEGTVNTFRVPLIALASLAVTLALLVGILLSRILGS